MSASLFPRAPKMGQSHDAVRLSGIVRLMLAVLPALGPRHAEGALLVT